MHGHFFAVCSANAPPLLSHTSASGRSPRSALDVRARPRIYPTASTATNRTYWLKTALTGAHRILTACDDNRYAYVRGHNLGPFAHAIRHVFRPLEFHWQLSIPLCHLHNFEQYKGTSGDNPAAASPQGGLIADLLEGSRLMKQKRSQN